MSFCLPDVSIIFAQWVAPGLRDFGAASLSRNGAPGLFTGDWGVGRVF
jgi:hypothetical protein